MQTSDTEVVPKNVREHAPWYAFQHWRNRWTVVRGAAGSDDFERAPNCPGRMTKDAADKMADYLNQQQAGCIVTDDIVPTEMPSQEEPRKNDKLNEAIETTFDLFYPRHHWTTPSVWSCSEQELSLVIFLCVMIQNGIVERITDRARIEFCKGRYTLPSGVWSEEQRQAYWLCQSRRGNDDLKCQSWSAYLALQKRFPEDETTILTSPCFLTYTEPQHAIIVPGNCSPRSILDFVAERRIRSLFFINGCVDEAVLQAEGVSEDEDYWLLDGLKFSDQAIDLFAEEFAKERASMERLLSETSHRMHSIFEAKFGTSNLDNDSPAK